MNYFEIASQVVLSSLKSPFKDHPPPHSSSSNPQQRSQSMLNHYYHPYYNIALNDSDAIPDEQRLMAQLLRNYDPSARPVYNASNTVSVAFGISLTQLSDMVCDYNNTLFNRAISWNLTNLFNNYAN
jgi:hypothetical protein